MTENIDFSLVYLQDTAAGSTNSCVTIDSDTNDNGYLAGARGAYPGYMSHGKTAEAVDNLLSCLAPHIVGGSSGSTPGLPIIVGHGNIGIFATGGGQNPFTDSNNHLLATFNQSAWQADIGRLSASPSAMLSLISCDTGAGEDGADLLFEMAKLINYPVRARTGLTYAGNGQITFQAGSTWQTATPQSRPTAIQPPVTPLLGDRTLIIRLINDDGSEREVDLGAVDSVEIYLPSQTAPEQVGPNARLQGSAARDILSLVNFAAPARPGGALGAIVTGRLRVNFYEREGGALQSREFVIYNDRVLEDASTPGVLYWASPGIRAAFDSLR
ncbi:hypothetical protein LWC35_17930 [Pseudonocardia kujensis]|uniref:hypothetical protein n=1 Tax=Pseudonocardia kujensis TaxID=1128675 RepID=UPI001E3BF123|nr:hypothetical protein [Pseudonocardia kujensis]MCE0764773.1 hypothetical protein [Pseudonocardia kujensis]